MLKLSKKWEIVLLPVMLIVAFSMVCLLEGCKNETDKDSDKSQIKKTGNDKKTPVIDKDETKPEETDTKEPEPTPEDENKKPIDETKKPDDETKKPDE
ncbi:MAG: hypothetical protein K8S87_09875 [Planctomycetes bacterium]|nr:hypothetical protein [Planctomycetota bacterium]